MEINYCYINDSMGFINNSFAEGKDYEVCEPPKKYTKRVTICGESYKDPDAVSKKLYMDMMKLFSKPFISNGLENNLKVKPNITKSKAKQWYLKYDDKYEHELSIDFIGPSCATAFEKLEEVNGETKSEQIGNYLLKCRTIGGHVFWPAHQKEVSFLKSKQTINQIKGGAPLYDRIDVTLAELKNFFDNKGAGKARYNEALFNAFKRYKYWFQLFEDEKDANKSFINYIKYFVLESFVDEENSYNVLSLATSSLNQEDKISKKYIVSEYPESNNISEYIFLPNNYNLYVENCVNAIIQRSNKLINKDPI